MKDWHGLLAVLAMTLCGPLTVASELATPLAGEDVVFEPCARSTPVFKKPSRPLDAEEAMPERHVQDCRPIRRAFVGPAESEGRSIPLLRPEPLVRIGHTIPSFRARSVFLTLEFSFKRLRPDAVT